MKSNRAGKITVRKANRILSMGLLLTLAFIAPIQTVEAGEITVPSNPLWTDTGLEGPLTLYGATGRWSWADGVPQSGPDGDPRPALAWDEWITNGRHGQLIGYQGESPIGIRQNDPSLFEIGTGTIILRNQARIWLGFNDDFASGAVGDNAGTVTVNWESFSQTIEVTRTTDVKATEATRWINQIGNPLAILPDAGYYCRKVTWEVAVHYERTVWQYASRSDLIHGTNGFRLDHYQTDRAGTEYEYVVKTDWSTPPDTLPTGGSTRTDGRVTRTNRYGCPEEVVEGPFLWTSFVEAADALNIVAKAPENTPYGKVLSNLSAGFYQAAETLDGLGTGFESYPGHEAIDLALSGDLHSLAESFRGIGTDIGTGDPSASLPYSDAALSLRALTQNLLTIGSPLIVPTLQSLANAAIYMDFAAEVVSDGIWNGYEPILFLWGLEQSRQSLLDFGLNRAPALLEQPPFPLIPEPHSLLVSFVGGILTIVRHGRKNRECLARQ